MRTPDSLTPVVCRMLARLAVAEGVDRPVVLDLRYDSADPYAVSMAFHLCSDHSVEWVVGRDLLLNGQHDLTGMGDVQVWPSRCSWVSEVCIALRPCWSHEAGVVTAQARTLDAFLRQTLAVLPAGTEERHLDLDGTVRQLLCGPGQPHR